MRRFLLSMWGITIAMVPGEALQILPHENGRQIATKLWLKFALAWVLLFGPLLLLNVVPEYWLRLVLGMISMLFVCSPIFAALDVYLFYGLPGVRLLDEDGLLVKDSGSANCSFYPYQDVTHIHQITSTEKSRLEYHLELVFADGSRWHTTKRPNSGVPFLIHLTDLIKEKCECPISPVFDAENAGK